MSEAGEQSWLLRVVDIVQETDDTRSISLRVPERLRAEFAYRPGQFLTVAVPSRETGLVARAYSLSSSPLTPDPITFTVKRTPEGYASAWIHDHVRIDDHLRVLRPAGIFSPRSLDDDLLLLAAGSGITPIMSIIRTALAPVGDGGGTGRLALFYASRDRTSVIFADAIEELRRTHPDRFEVVHWLEEERGLPGREQIGAFAASYGTWDSFCCGPTPFMTTVAETLRELGFPRQRRHQERFVSLGGNPFGDLPA